ncbi:MAG: four helix bundle protein, partial [Verrucomicrobiae bacterium]|nr:four helix bundle protein [Verrucomicrobiae bacterium]
MNFDAWGKTVPQTITGDLLWKVNAYRVALFLSDVVWRDATKLAGDQRTLSLSDQHYRAVGSISANVSEGYSRSSGKDRVRFYEYATASAREARDWYFKGRHVLGFEVANHRMQLLAEIIRLLLTMIPEQRSVLVREEHAACSVSAPSDIAF